MRAAMLASVMSTTEAPAQAEEEEEYFDVEDQPPPVATLGLDGFNGLDGFDGIQETTLAPADPVIDAETTTPIDNSGVNQKSGFNEDDEPPMDDGGGGGVRGGSRYRRPP